MSRPREFDKEQVLDQAMMVFLERGYEATSVRDLIKAMNISSSSMYEVFGDKRSIFLHVLERYFALEQAVVVQMSTQAASSHEIIDQLFANIDAMQGPRRSLSLVTMVEFGTRDREILHLLLGHYSKIVEIIAARLGEAQANGEIPMRVPAVDLTHTILSALYGLITITSVKPDFAYREAIKRTILTLIS